MTSNTPGNVTLKMSPESRMASVGARIRSKGDNPAPSWHFACALEHCCFLQSWCAFSRQLFVVLHPPYSDIDLTLFRVPLHRYFDCAIIITFLCFSPLCVQKRCFFADFSFCCFLKFFIVFYFISTLVFITFMLFSVSCVPDPDGC